MQTATVYYREVEAGTLSKDADGYTFRYEERYLANPEMPAVSATLPKDCAEYHSQMLFPFFSGLLAEGVQKERQCREFHLDERDDFARLLATSANGAIGAVYVKARKANAV